LKPVYLHFNTINIRKVLIFVNLDVVMGKEVVWSREDLIRDIGACIDDLMDSDRDMFTRYLSRRIVDHIFVAGCLQHMKDEDDSEGSLRIVIDLPRTSDCEDAIIETLEGGGTALPMSQSDL